MFVSVGSGDSFTATRILMKLIVEKRIPVHPRVVELCAAWLGPYALREDHARLRLLIAELNVLVTDRGARMSSRSLTCSRHPATLPALDLHRAS